MRIIKNGAPIMEVKRPRGISTVSIERARLSIKSKKEPPKRNETGKR